MSTAPEDPVLLYIESEKELLRRQFREKKAEADDHRAKADHAERELSAVKSRMAYTDELMNRRLRELGRKLESTSPSLPHLGRFSQMGPTVAIKQLFDTDPDQELNAPGIAEILIKEGFQTSSSNLASIVFTVCKRLEASEFLQSRRHMNVTYFQKKRGDSAEAKSPQRLFVERE